jgi:tetratricopeptide (TPR) repeat protein
LDSPFKELSGADLALEDSEEELLTGENLFIDEAFMEVEKNVEDELEAIVFWLKELEKQRTSTIEKNMMEIFEEFKKGVDEKIGKEDYDTRYNLGIAYKEMGLLEEAIHEFLISAKHPAKFFDSAGLLGMCFREKGMFNEAITWFDKALETPERRKEEYLAVKYEMVITLKLKENFRGAIKMLEEIIKVSPNYRNVAQLHGEIKTLITG